MNSVTSMVEPSATHAPWNCTTFDALLPGKQWV